MVSRFRFAILPVIALVFFLLCPRALTPQVRRSRALITQNIDRNKLHPLRGNTRPEANAQNDLGPVRDELALQHMLLQLQRPPEQEQAMRSFIDRLHDPQSPNYHKWLSPQEFGQAFGPAQSDLDTITNWLQSNGFTVNEVYPSGMLIDFSGTAGQVRNALHTEIHALNVNGREHIANMSDPQIPAALAPAVAGVVSMHDFLPHAMRKSRAAYTYVSGSSTEQALTPGDLATIYNLNPLFNSGFTGQGQTIAVIEDTDLYNTADWDTFRTAFGLFQYTSGSLSTVHPVSLGGASNCIDPGVANGDDGEAALDAEWASAAAPGASIVVASCANTRTTFGGLIALQNLINSAGGRPSAISISYGQCEAENGSSANAAFNAIYQQAVAEGVSIFVAAGDEGAAGCDSGASAATHGIGVSAWASTPYNVAVGGTDFSDTLQGTAAAYWSSTNTSTYSSAQSYIPEIPWNDSCAGSLLASYFNFTTTYGTDGFCGSTTARQNNFLVVAAGSGGPSGCASGTPDIAGVVGGTCQGYAKPTWQTGIAGLPNDGVRDLPDVSLFAGDGVWGHYYEFCWSDVKKRSGGSGAPCTGDPSGWSGAGGTSFAAPIMAGIQALVNQHAGGPQGNPNYVYYQLAASQPSGACNSASGPSASCIFNNITQGDINVNCGGTDNCFGSSGGAGFGRRASGGNGALSTSSQSYAPAYTASSGWSFATGNGSVNAYNLVTNWITK